MSTKTRTLTVEAELREVIDRWLESFRSKDLASMLQHYAPDIVLFDVKPPLQHKGMEAYRKVWEDFLPCVAAPVDYTMHDQRIVASDDVAFCHSLNHLGVTGSSGERHELWLRATVCLQKIAGQWQVKHEHVSVPYNPMTGQASLDLKP
jgi:uncharacterized protein (TIGR02246 family)